MSSSHISNVDNIKIIRCIPIIMVPLDSLDYFFFSNLGKIVAKVYTTINCRFSKVVYFQARWIWLGCSRHTAFRHIYSKQNLSRPRGELIYFTSVFHGKTLCLCVLQFCYNVNKFYSRNIPCDPKEVPQLHLIIKMS